MNLEEMSLEQLQQLHDNVSHEIRLRRVQAKKDTLLKIMALAAAGGYTLEELVAGDAVLAETKSVRKVPPKYRNFAQPDQTWTGRGKTPHWVTDYLASGKDLSELLIR